MGEFSTRRWETRESPLRSGMEDYSMDMREPADSHGQKAMRMRRLRSWSKIVLWASLLGQMGGVAGLASPERRDPTYHASRYLQPCKTVADCGARQVCLSGQCTCPFILGLTGAPECTTKSKGAWILLCWSIMICVLELGLATLHVLNLKAHWTQTQPQPQPSSGSPSSTTPPGTLKRLRPPAVAPSSKPPSPSAIDTPVLAVPWCEVLLTYKSLFSLSSLVFCLAPVSLTFTLALIVLDGQSDVELLYSSAGSVQTVVAILSFNCMALSYLFMGEIWLDAASRFRLRTFIGTRLSKLLIQLPAAVLCVLTVFYVLTSDSPSAQMLVAMLGLGVCALIASGFLTMGASIMIPVIRARAKQAEEARKAVTVSIVAAGEADDREGPKERRSILRLLRRKRNAPFRPVLSRISEKVSSAIERSASHGYLSSGSSRRSIESSVSVLSRSGRGRVGPGDEEEEEGMARPSQLHVQREGSEDMAVEDVEGWEEAQAGAKPAVQRKAPGGSFDGLAWHVASTAMQVGGASVLSVVAYVVGFFLIAHARDKAYDPVIGAMGTLFLYMAFPLFHLYGNFICLVVISREARDAAAPFRAALSRGAALLSDLLWNVLCCGMPDDSLSDTSGLGRKSTLEALDEE